jgi:hypothetical protein
MFSMESNKNAISSAPPWGASWSQEIGFTSQKNARLMTNAAPNVSRLRTSSLIAARIKLSRFVIMHEFARRQIDFDQANARFYRLDTPGW